MKKLTQLLVATITFITFAANASPVLGSFTPSLTDLYLLYADPARAAAALGWWLAGILLVYGVIWFFITYILPWIRKS